MQAINLDAVLSFLKSDIIPEYERAYLDAIQLESAILDALNSCDE